MMDGGNLLILKTVVGMNDGENGWRESRFGVPRRAEKASYHRSTLAEPSSPAFGHFGHLKYTIPPIPPSYIINFF